MKIDVMFNILLTLLAKNKVTAQYLATKFEISVRTVYRYVSVLNTSNIPVVTKSGKNGGIWLYNSFSIKQAFFTNEEKITLLNLTQGLQNQELKIKLQTKLLAMQ